MDVEPVAMSEDDDDVDDEEDDDEEEEEDEEEAKLPTILQTVHHASDDDESDDDESDDEEEEEEEDGDGDEEGRAMPPSMPPPPNRPAEPAAAEKQLQVFAARARPARAAPAGMAPPVSMNQVLADTARAPAKRRRAKGSRARGKGKGGKGKLPPDVSRMLGEANMCYVSQDFQQAIRMLEEVVRRAPRVSDPYHTLGLVYEEMDDQKRALECYLIAAYLTGKDVETWKRVATMSRDQGLLHQAIYCINRALRLAPGDVNAQYTRATVLVELGQLKKGSEAYKALLKLRPHDAAVAAEMARLHTKNGESAQAIKVLNDCLDNNIALANGDTRDTAKEQERAANNALAPVKLPPSAKAQLLDEDDDPEEKIATDDRDGMGGSLPGGEAHDPQPYLNAQLHLCNILAELYMSKGKFADTIKVIEELEQRGVCGTSATPLDLAVKCGICKVYIGKPEGASEQFSRLRAEDVSAYADLYFDVAEALLALDSHERALEFYEPLLKQQEYNQPAIWLKIGRCHLCLCSGEQASSSAQGRSGRASGAALRYYTKVLKAVPNNSEAAVAIASLHVADGKPETALRLLDQVFAQLDMASVDYPPASLDSSTAASADEQAAAVAEQQGSEKRTTIVPADSGGLQLLVEKARLLHSFKRYDEYLSLILVHIHRAVHAIVPVKVARAQADASAGGAPVGRKRKGGAGSSDGGAGRAPPTLADVLTDRAFLNLGAKAATIMTRKRNYAAANVTIRGLLRFNSRSSKPSKTEVASSGSSAGGSKSGDRDSPTLFAYIPYSSDEEDEDDEASGAGNASGDDDSAAAAAAAGAEAPPRQGGRRSRTKDGHRSMDQLRMLAVGVSYVLKDYERAYATIRNVCELRPSSTTFWNLYNTISMHCQGTQPGLEKSQPHRFLIKLLGQHPDSVPLMMLVGHHCAATRNLGLSIAEYLRASSLRPTDPLILLCLGTSYLCQVMQKNTYNRHLVCLKAFTFMDQYANLRLPGFKLDLREDQEGAGADDAEPEAEDAMEVVSVDGDDSDDGGGGGGGSDDDPETAECATFHALTPKPPPTTRAAFQLIPRLKLIRS